MPKNFGIKPKLESLSNMSRELKFRIYVPQDKGFVYFGLQDYPQGIYGAVSEPMQFTNRHDRNGKEIYEDDIVERVYDKYRYQVVYDLSDSAYICIDKNGDDVFLADYDFNIIGNIHENAELLK